MYGSYRTGKLKFFLILSVIIIILRIMCRTLNSSAENQNQTEQGVFLPVIMYHSIIENPQTDYQLSPEMFADDLYYLYANGYETVSVSQLHAYTEGKADLPEKPVLLTFDDGFYNNLSLALPILEEYNMCAVVSIVGYYTENNAEKDPHIDSYSYLTWEDIQKLLQSGRIEIGSHTYNLHSNENRAGCSIRYGEDKDAYTAMLREDLEKVQAGMLEHTGIVPEIFAYPYGFVCRESIPVLKEMGFICTLTCREQGNYITYHPECLYQLDRYNRNPAESTEAFFSRILTAS